MAVHYIDGGGGLLGTLSKAAQLGSMFIPGMQPWAAAIGAASALANGDPAGAVANVAGHVIGNKAQAGGGYAPNESLMNTLYGAHKGRFTY
jgi:hypothetical protein